MPTIKFGLNVLTNTSYTGKTIGQLKADGGMRSALGFDGNASALVNNVSVSDDYIVRENDVVSFQTRAASKA